MKSSVLFFLFFFFFRVFFFVVGRLVGFVGLCWCGGGFCGVFVVFFWCVFFFCLFFFLLILLLCFVCFFFFFFFFLVFGFFFLFFFFFFLDFFFFFFFFFFLFFFFFFLIFFPNPLRYVFFHEQGFELRLVTTVPASRATCAAPQNSRVHVCKTPLTAQWKQRHLRPAYAVQPSPSFYVLGYTSLTPPENPPSDSRVKYKAGSENPASGYRLSFKAISLTPCSPYTPPPLPDTSDGARRTFINPYKREHQRPNPWPSRCPNSYRPYPNRQPDLLGGRRKKRICTCSLDAIRSKSSRFLVRPRVKSPGISSGTVSLRISTPPFWGFLLLYGDCGPWELY